MIYEKKSYIVNDRIFTKTYHKIILIIENVKKYHNLCGGWSIEYREKRYREISLRYEKSC